MERVIVSGVREGTYLHVSWVRLVSGITFSVALPPFHIPGVADGTGAVGMACTTHINIKPS